MTEISLPIMACACEPGRGGDAPAPPPASPAAVDASVELLHELRHLTLVCARMIAADHADTLEMRASLAELVRDLNSIGTLLGQRLVDKILTPENIDKMLAGQSTNP